MEMYAKTDIGQKRQSNQDAYYISPEGHWCVLADGMGGHNGGETASRMTVEALVRTVNGPGTLVTGIEQANETVYRLSLQQEELAGMGSTVVAAYFEDGTATIAHVGDSRAYQLSGGVLTQVTKDHSIVQQLLDCGSISSADADVHPQKNLITRAIGTERNVLADVHELPYQSGDRFLLCSDGLTNFVSKPELLTILQTYSGQEAVDLLVQKANDSGGLDNITAIVITL